MRRAAYGVARLILLLARFRLLPPRSVVVVSCLVQVLLALTEVVDVLLPLDLLISLRLGLRGSVVRPAARLLLHGLSVDVLNLSHLLLGSAAVCVLVQIELVAHPVRAVGWIKRRDVCDFGFARSGLWHCLLQVRPLLIDPLIRVRNRLHVHLRLECVGAIAVGSLCRGGSFGLLLALLVNLEALQACVALLGEHLEGEAPRASGLFLAQLMRMTLSRCLRSTLLACGSA